MRTNLSDVFDDQERATLKPRIVLRNTFRYTRPTDGATVYRLHRTDILEVLPDGSERMNSGGWRSMTTKDRIDSFSKYRLSQSKGEWFVSDPSEPTRRVPYFDGITLPRDFAPAGQAKGAATLAEREALDNEIKAFVAKLGKKGAPIPAPSNGDCWFCMMRTAPGALPDAARAVGVSEEEAARFGVAMGDASGDTSHLLEHVREGYMHGSLIANALIHSGVREPRFIFQMGDATRMRRALLKYLRARLLR